MSLLRAEGESFPQPFTRSTLPQLVSSQGLVLFSSFIYIYFVLRFENALKVGEKNPECAGLKQEGVVEELGGEGAVRSWEEEH